MPFGVSPRASVATQYLSGTLARPLNLRARPQPGVEAAQRAQEHRVVLLRGILLENGVRAAPDCMGWISGAIKWVLGLLSQELARVWEIHARRSTSVEKLFAEQAHGRAGLTRASG